MELHVKSEAIPVAPRFLELKIEPPSADHSYRYSWSLGKPDGKRDELGESTSAILELDTHDKRYEEEGIYTVMVKAKLDPPDQAGVPSDATEGYGEFRFSISQRGAYLPPEAEALITASGSLGSELERIKDKLPDPIQPTRVVLQRSGAISDALKEKSAFYAAIRNRTAAIGFEPYQKFIDRLLCSKRDASLPACGGKGDLAKDMGAPRIHRALDALDLSPTIYGVDAYTILKSSTQAFLAFEAGLVVSPARKDDTGDFADWTDPMPGESGRMDGDVTYEEVKGLLERYVAGGTYLDTIASTLVDELKVSLPYCKGTLLKRFSCPSLLELIFCYWWEEAGLMQTLNAIALRFQNKRGRLDRDPLAQYELAPLHPLNNLLWGFIQDQQNRLTLTRRAYEYEHQYGISLQGRAVPTLRPADTRSKFLQAFHNLLHIATQFYTEDADSTVTADAFPLLNALKEVHLVLAEGAHNQFGDLPWTARAEILMQQWLLSRPEMRAFLGGRAMVPYPESWMGQLDTMKKLQGWTDASVTHFHSLAVTGEQLLLSIRYYDWTNVDQQDEAKVWARYWQAEVQRYVHAYRGTTGVDLTREPVDTTPPSIHLKRMEDQKKRRAT